MLHPSQEEGEGLHHGWSVLVELVLTVSREPHQEGGVRHIVLGGGCFIMGPILGKLCVGKVGYGLECDFKSLYRF